MATLKTLAIFNLFKNDRGPAQADEELGGTTFDGLSGIEDDKEAEESVRTPRIAFTRSNTVGSFGTAFTRTSTFTSFTSFTQPSWLRRLKNFVFPPHDDDVDSYVPTYRFAPILSGLTIPFCILLEIPGLTEYWYIRTEGNQTVETQPNPLILNVGLGISISCAVLANVALLLRFLEKRTKTMTVLCIIFLSCHDIINITAVTIFGVVHRFNDGFTYGQAFWITVCSTAVSTFTIGTLIYDLIKTKDFDHSGSGLTRKQRSLVIIIMILFSYICVGAVVNTFLIGISFIDALYFTLVCIETIGFGDIVPVTPGAQVFVCAYSISGIIILGTAIGTTRDTVIEALEVQYRKRVKIARARRLEHRRIRRILHRWKVAITWRLKAKNLPIWTKDPEYVPKAGGGRGAARKPQVANINRGYKNMIRWIGLVEPSRSLSKKMHGPPGMVLNLGGLTKAQLEAAAFEAGVPLADLLPEDFDFHEFDKIATKPDTKDHSLTQKIENLFHPDDAHSLTHARMGGMVQLLTRFAVAFPRGEDGMGQFSFDHTKTANTAASGSAIQWHGSSHDTTHEADHHSHKEEAAEERKAFYSKLTVAFTLFFSFWMIGAAIFMTTEGWGYGESMYFCFVAFSTIGFGDHSPQTPAGRVVFVVWAIMGVATLTILISVIQEAIDSRSKNALHVAGFDKALHKYRQRQETKPVRRRPRPGRHHHRPTLIRPSSPTGSFQSTNDSVLSPSVLLAEARERTQESLEALPAQVLHQAQRFHDYIKLWGDNADHTDPTSDAGKLVDDHLRKLLDEVAGDTPIGISMKKEILHDEDARHKLFMLSMERSLQQIISAAEEAVESLRELDGLEHVPRDGPTVGFTDPPAS